MVKHDISEVKNPTYDDVHKQIDREGIEDGEFTEDEYKLKWNEEP